MTVARFVRPVSLQSAASTLFPALLQTHSPGILPRHLNGRLVPCE